LGKFSSAYIWWYEKRSYLCVHIEVFVLLLPDYIHTKELSLSVNIISGNIVSYPGAQLEWYIMI
jgi:hypothetical protein